MYGHCWALSRGYGSPCLARATSLTGSQNSIEMTAPPVRKTNQKSLLNRLPAQTRLESAQAGKDDRLVASTLISTHNSRELRNLLHDLLCAHRERDRARRINQYRRLESPCIFDYGTVQYGIEYVGRSARRGARRGARACRAHAAACDAARAAAAWFVVARARPAAAHRVVKFCDERMRSVYTLYLV
jgi:hypothetical protein